MAKNKFEQSFSWAQSNGTLETLAFAGATQRGRSWNHENNQDALAIASGESYLVAVLSDGCSTAPAGTSSHNEVGAKIISRLVCQYFNERLKKESVSELEANFPNHVSTLVSRLRVVASTCAGGFDHDAFVQSYLTATVLGLVIDAKQFMFFGYGDGLYAVDGEFNNLEENSGFYIAHDLFESSTSECSKSHFKIYHSGLAGDYTSLLIATDGLEDIVSDHCNAVETYLKDPTMAAQKRVLSGYDSSLIGAFRKTVLFRPDYIEWEERQDNFDDRTFFIVSNLVEKPAQAPAQVGLARTNLLVGQAHAKEEQVNDRVPKLESSTAKFFQATESPSLMGDKDRIVSGALGDPQDLEEFRKKFILGQDYQSNQEAARVAPSSVSGGPEVAPSRADPQVLKAQRRPFTTRRKRPIGRASSRKLPSRRLFPVRRHQKASLRNLGARKPKRNSAQGGIQFIIDVSILKKQLVRTPRMRKLAQRRVWRKRRNRNCCSV